MEGRLRTRLASVAVLLVVLAAGFVLGVAWERRGPSLRAEAASETVDGDERRARGREDRDRGRDDEKKKRRLIVDRVGLRAAQEARVDSIVESHREQMRALHKEFRREYNPRYWSLIQETRDAIRSVLDPEQRARYDSLLAEHDRKRNDGDEDDDDEPNTGEDGPGRDRGSAPSPGR